MFEKAQDPGDDNLFAGYHNYGSLLGPHRRAVDIRKNVGGRMAGWKNNQRGCALACLCSLVSLWVLTTPATAQIVPLQPRTNGPCKTVFGYLPYWNKTATLRYDLLTHVVHFSVGANADGTLSNPRSWPWTTQINAAHNAGVKVILCVTQFDEPTTLTLVTTPAYKNAFFSNIKNMMLQGKADGLNIDFEGTGEFRSHINQFMADLTAYLHAQIPGSEVTFAGPAVNWSSAWDLTGLANSCDGIFIMGYDFYGSWSTTSGPSAPLTGGSYNVTNTVYTQYRQVQQTHPEKLILGVPYYGNHWTTSTSSARSTRIAHVGSVTFAKAQVDSATYGLLWDATSQTPWYRWHDGTNWHQVWFDNADSLRLKYQLALDAGLQGVGMWCLGNDPGRNELWDLLQEKFINGCREPWDAVVLAQEFPSTMMVGDSATAYVEFQNTGGQNWVQGEVNLGTWDPQDRTSSFYTADDWISAQRPATADSALTSPDGTCRFTFTITAPSTPGVYNESWRLVKEGTTWFGPTDVTFQITVTPRPMPGDFDNDEDVDQADFGFLQNCLDSGMVMPSPSCVKADLNGDIWVDSRDVTVFTRCMRGPNVPGDTTCTGS